MFIMESNEEWSAWNPTGLSRCHAYSASIHLNDLGFHVIVECDIGRIEILFCGLVPSYTYSVEGIRMATWAPIQEKNNDKKFFTKWFVFKIENSKYKKWAIQESCGFYTEKELSHFRIVTGYEVIDILSLGEPQFIFL